MNIIDVKINHKYKLCSLEQAEQINHTIDGPGIVRGMKKFFGTTVTVTFITSAIRSTKRRIKIKEDNGESVWAYQWLEKEMIIKEHFNENLFNID